MCIPRIFHFSFVLLVLMSFFTLSISANDLGGFTSKWNSWDSAETVHRDQLQIRDPFIHRDDEYYYLYGTNPVSATDPDHSFGFDCYRSKDLIHWEGPLAIFRNQGNFWGTEHFWAAEMHFYQGKYYLFATFKSPDRCRGTQILIADRPDGMFAPLSDQAVTPADRECLDGTLYVDPAGTPWMFFCHEWLQIKDGSICAMPLKKDLSAPDGEVITLFTASSAPWVRSIGENNYVTDGPWFFEQNGRLLMLWSSFGEKGYALGVAESASGTISGPWSHHPEPLYQGDGGHGMIFQDRNGKSWIAIHSDNSSSKGQRLKLLPLTEIPPILPEQSNHSIPAQQQSAQP